MYVCVMVVWWCGGVEDVCCFYVVCRGQSSSDVRGWWWLNFCFISLSRGSMVRGGVWSWSINHPLTSEDDGELSFVFFLQVGEVWVGGRSRDVTSRLLWPPPDDVTSRLLSSYLMTSHPGDFVAHLVTSHPGYCWFDWWRHIRVTFPKFPKFLTWPIWHP